MQLSADFQGCYLSTELNKKKLPQNLDTLCEYLCNFVCKRTKVVYCSQICVLL